MFTDYITTMYDRKNHTKGSERALYKSLLNNFIGRWALRLSSKITNLINHKDYLMLSIGHSLSHIQPLQNDCYHVVDINPKIDNNISCDIDVNKYINSSGVPLKTQYVI